METLRDWIPLEAALDGNLTSLLPYPVVADFEGRSSPFRQKHIYAWCVVYINDSKSVWPNGAFVAVGWNENPNRGWSFPVKQLSKIWIEHLGLRKEAANETEN